MEEHLRYADIEDSQQRSRLASLILQVPELVKVLRHLEAMRLPDYLVGGGAIYQTVWNALTGRPRWYGVKDIDVIYFDDSDLCYEAEDRVIRAVLPVARDLPIPIQIRNQARVHLWFEERFGFSVEPLTCSKDALLRYSTKTHSVAVRLADDDQLHIEAPFGLNDMFSFRVVPNYALDNRNTHEEKAARAKTLWPEVRVHHW
ncbi:nucleotidyltransferase family protein [Rhizobium leguminosarum]|nr:nucleotidyltransferase family protein [Rhizobium leguminosarum]